MPKKRKREPSRHIQQIFDDVFKQLMWLSDLAIVQFINGLFETDHPADSVVHRVSTENVSRRLRKTLADVVIIINNVSYHIETQISDDEDMALRMFEYGFAESLRGRGTSVTEDSGHPGEDTITLRFPQARLIYWEVSGKTPDKARLNLVFPDNTEHRFEVEVLKFLDHSIQEL